MSDAPKAAMPLCLGCGFHNEAVDSFGHECIRCRAEPLLRESYRRGFNAGVEAMRSTLDSSANSLRRWSP